MRLRRHHKKYTRESKATAVPKEDIPKEPTDTTGHRENTEPAKTVIPETVIVETHHQSTPVNLLRRIINNPNFNFQAVIILLTLFSDNFPMERHLNGITTTVDKIRNVTEVVNNTMQSLKVASEAPRHIRRLLE